MVAQEYHRLNEEKKAIESKMKALKEQLMEGYNLKEAKSVEVDGLKLSYSESFRENVTNEALKEYDVTLFDKLKSVVLVGTLRVSKSK